MDMLIFSGITLGLTQLFKVSFGIRSKFVPLTSLVLSLLMFSVWILLQRTAGISVPITWELVATLLVTTLVSNGMWSSVKSSTK